MTQHLKEMAGSIEVAQRGIFLEELNQNWIKHNKALQMIRDILMYMDRTYVPTCHKTPICKLGLNLWRDHVIRSAKIKPRLLDTLLDHIHRERTGDVIDRGLMRDLLKMLMDLGPHIYQEDFETPFLDATLTFYKLESQAYIEACDCGDYLKKAERRLNEEIERVSHYLDVMSELGVTAIVEQEMITNHVDQLVYMKDSGLVFMLRNNKYEDLARMYSLFQRVSNGLCLVRDEMSNHLKETGRQLVTDPENLKDPVEFVQLLLDEKDKYDKVVATSFKNDSTFQNVVNSLFELYFINLNARSAEFISLYVDDIMRKGLDGVNEGDIERTLDRVMMLFRCLEEKDVFEKYHRQHLARRLLSGACVLDDAERSLIVKLKAECGEQFTSKLEAMLKGFYDFLSAAGTDG
jgi:cullin 3